MAEQPLVSILMTTFNHAAYVEQTMRSVLTQTYANLQLVVSDDGSTDGTPEIVKALARDDSRVVALCSPVNRGMSANWNQAYAGCTGELVALLSGDDIMLPPKIAAQVAYLQQHPECGVCTHDMDVFDSATGRTMYRLNERFAPKEGGAEVMFTTNWLFGREIKSIPSSHMFRASAIGSHRFDERLRIWNEWLHEIDCLASSRWGALRDVLGRYRVHAKQTSTGREAVRVGFDETMMVLAIAGARYPELARLVKNKREFVMFQHLIFDWFPEDKRPAFDAALRIEAGFSRWAYMRAARFFVRRPWLVHASRPARRLLRALGGRP